MEYRSGPHPLSVHLGMAASNSIYMQSHSSGVNAEKTEIDLIEMMRGIQLYQKSQHIAERPEIQIVQNVNGANLYKFKSGNIARNQRPLLIIPSLVNRSYIFNLNKDRSIISFVKEQGIDAYVLDWCNLEGKEFSSLSGVINIIISGAIDHLLKLHPQHHNIDVLGYCMGGILALGAARNRSIRNIVLLASPWDFQHEKNHLARLVRIGASGALGIIDQKGKLPLQWIQALFASLDSDAAIQKFIKFSKMDQNSTEAKMFIDVEDWLNDNVDIPENIARSCLKNWFIDNALVQNNWSFGGSDFDLKSINSNILIVASTNDRIVPYETVISMKDFFTNAQVEVIKSTCGHIGFIAGKNAIQETWHPIINWLKKN